MLRPKQMISACRRGCSGTVPSLDDVLEEEEEEEEAVVTEDDVVKQSPGIGVNSIADLTAYSLALAERIIHDALTVVSSQKGGHCSPVGTDPRRFKGNTEDPSGRCGQPQIHLVPVRPRRISSIRRSLSSWFRLLPRPKRNMRRCRFPLWKKWRMLGDQGSRRDRNRDTSVPLDSVNASNINSQSNQQLQQRDASTSSRGRRRALPPLPSDGAPTETVDPALSSSTSDLTLQMSWLSPGTAYLPDDYDDEDEAGLNNNDIADFGFSGESNSSPDRVMDFAKSIEAVKSCRWYWGPISGEAAERQLADESDGSFLVRDSSADHYLFSLSFKMEGTVRHVRIEQNQGNFSFGTFTKFKSKTIVEFIEKAVEVSRSGRYLFFLHRRPSLGPMRVQLTHPVSRFTTVQSLQHQCRFTILCHVPRDLLHKLPVPPKIQEYLNTPYYYSESIADDTRNSVTPSSPQSDK